MYSKERINQVMRGTGTPDQIPLMCQLSLGHIYKNAGISPEKFWFTPEGCAEGYIRMAERYSFDGILVNVWQGIERQKVRSVCVCGDGHNVTLENNQIFYCPPNEYPRRIDYKAESAHRSIEDVEVEYVVVVVQVYVEELIVVEAVVDCVTVVKVDVVDKVDEVVAVVVVIRYYVFLIR